MELQLINVGRSKVNKTVTVKDAKEMWQEIGRHLLSNELELIETKVKNKYTVYAGMRAVGEVIINHKNK